MKSPGVHNPAGPAMGSTGAEEDPVVDDPEVDK